MNYVIYQGIYYEVLEFIRDNSGNITHVRIETQSGGTVTIPIGQVTVVQYPTLGGVGGGAVGGGGSGGTGATNNIIFSDSAPTNPQAGQVWRNTNTVTVAGVPAGNFAVWNGTAWVPVGAGQPSSSVISSGTAPTGPSLGQVWLNTSGGTVSGVPAGNFAVWNGTAWVPVGTFQPSSSTASAAATLTLTGDATGTGTGTIPVTLANSGAVAGTYGSATELVGVTVDAKGRITSIQEFALPPASGGGITEIDVNGVGNLVGNVNFAGTGVNLTGQTISFDAYATDAELTAAIAAHNSAPDPHSQYTLETEVFGSRFLAQNTAPASPQTGDIWRNTAGTTVNGIPSGNYAVWNGTAWSNSGSQYPFQSITSAVTPSALTPGANNTWLNTNGSGVVAWNPISLPTVERNPGFLASLATGYISPDNTVFQFIAGTESVDSAGFYNPATGIFTVPAGFGGVWLIGSLIQFTFPGVDPGLSIGATVNSVSYLPSDIVANGNYIASGFRPYVLSAGDIVRWYTFGGASNVGAGSILYGFLLFPI